MTSMKTIRFLRPCITRLVWLVQLVNLSLSEAQNRFVFNEETSQKIEWPYQLTFIHEDPKNKVDSLLIELLAYEYHQENGILKYKLLENIAKTKTKEAFYLLYVGCISQPHADNYFPPFQQLCYTIKKNNGLMLLNKYFLKHPIKETLLENDFEREVINGCKKMKPEIYYYKYLPQEISLDVLQEEIDLFKNKNIPCKSPEILNEKNLHRIQNVYELSFLHEKPVNRVDSCVKYLMDSIRWDGKRNWYLIIDSVVNSIGATQSQEALQLFYLFTKYNVTYQNNQLLALCQSLHGRQAEYLHNYFYKDKKLNKDSLGYNAYRKKLLSYFKNKVPTIYFCDEPTLQEVYTKRTESSELKYLDRKIIQIIKRNRRLNKTERREKLENEIRQLPFVDDVKLGDCYEILDIETTFYYDRIYTKLVVDDKLVERIYVIGIRRLLFIGIRLNKFPLGKIIHYHTKKWKYVTAYSYPALKAVKEYCGEKKKTRYN